MPFFVKKRYGTRDDYEKFVLDTILRVWSNEGVVESDFPRLLLVPHLSVTYVFVKYEFVVLEGFIVIIVLHA